MNLKIAIFKLIKCIIWGAIILVLMFKTAMVVSKNKDVRIRKLQSDLSVMDKWLNLMKSGESLSDILLRKSYTKVAIYGMSFLGKSVVNNLKETEVSIDYIIDRSEGLREEGLPPVYCPDDELPAVDLVIVSPVWDYDIIKKNLSKKLTCPIISLDTLLDA